VPREEESEQRRLAETAKEERKRRETKERAGEGYLIGGLKLPWKRVVLSHPSPSR
jgi:hypothetical protein